MMIVYGEQELGEGLPELVSALKEVCLPLPSGRCVSVDLSSGPLRRLGSLGLYCNYDVKAASCLL